ncbi:MAG: CBS domain-containing protein, partial [Bacteroidota bacterium]
THSVPVLKKTDTGSFALHTMADHHLSQLPIVQSEKLLGLVREEDILNHHNNDAKLQEMKLKLLKPFIHDYEHIFEVLKVSSELKLKVIPVVDNDENYLGAITLEDLMNYFARDTDILEPGAIVVLEIAVGDYSLADIARIIEQEGAKILCVFAGTDKEKTKIELTLKLNVSDIQGIIQSLQRHSYVIKDSYQEPEYFEDMKDRYDSLMDYLDV